MTRNHTRARTIASVLTGALILTVPSIALADEAREKELEKRLEALEKQIDELNRGGYAIGFNSELEGRIAQLEKNADYDGKGVMARGGSGLSFHTADKSWTFKVGGRVMNDFAWWASDSDTEAVVGEELNTATEFRRARFYMAGTINKNVEWKAQYDFAGGDADFKDVYIRLLNFLGMGGKLTVGHTYEPFSFQEQTSSKYLGTMERSPQVEAFSPGRSTGMSYRDSFKLNDGEQDGAFGIGVFRDSDSFGDDKGNTNSGEWNFTGRTSIRPWIDSDTGDFVNVGVNGTFKNYSDQMVRFRARPMVHSGPRFVDTGTIGADEGVHTGIDAAARFGQFWAEAEYMRAETDGTGGFKDFDADGFHVQTGYFLTGEKRPWKGDNWSRLKPKSNYNEGEGGGPGAWEVVAGFDTIDLNDGPIRGGEMDIWTVGVNWYLNPHTRIMLNFSDIDLDRGDADDVQAMQIRFQIDF